MIARKEQVIGNILIAVQAALTSIQLQILENAIREALRGYRLEEECTELATGLDDNEYILNLFVANKKIEGCKAGSIEQYLRQTKDLFRRTNKNYKDITKDDIKLYLAWYGRGKKPNTVANAKRFVGSFFTWAHDEGYISCNPVKSIKGIKPVQVENIHLDREEEIAVRDATATCCKRDIAIIDLLFSTGLRVGEIEALDRSDVDFKGSSITLQSEKSGRYRTVYLDVRARRHLEEYLLTREDNCEALFITHRIYENVYGIREGKRLGKHAYENITKSVGKKAGLTKSCTVHVFRRTLATRMSERGCPLDIIQEILGHADARTTSRHYVAKSATKIRRAFEQYLMAG